MMRVEMNVQVTGADPWAVVDFLSGEVDFLVKEDTEGEPVIVSTWFGSLVIGTLAWAQGVAEALNQEAAAVAFFDEETGLLLHGECVGLRADKWPFDLSKFVRY